MGKFGEAGTHTLVINPFGFALDKLSCVVRIDVELGSVEWLRDGTLGVVEVFSGEHLLTGPKSDMQQRLRAWVNEMVTALANEILKARGR